MRTRGFTLIEITAVAAIVSTLSIGGYQLVKKGKDSVCLNNLKQIGQAIAMFEADHDALPVAVFFPKDAGDPNGIHNILKKYGATGPLFFCPAISSDFNRYGTNYLWNEAARRQSPDSASTWLMTEITSLYPELPTPHTGGYGVLYADGHAAIGRDIKFPSFQRPALVATSVPEKKEERTVESKQEEITEKKSQASFGTYQVINLPPKIQAGKPVAITVRAVDTEGNLFETDEKLKLMDLTQSVEPSEISLQKGVANVMIQFKKVRPDNILIVAGQNGTWKNSSEFIVESGQPASIEIIPPVIAYAGIPANFKVIIKDAFGNKCAKEGIKLLVATGKEAEYPSEVFSDASGEINVGVVFHKSGENSVSFLIPNTPVKESCSLRVEPGTIDRYEISPIKSPVEAGSPVSLTVKAVDKYGNRAKGFVFSQDGCIVSYVNQDMSSGIWMETIKFEKAVSETFIVVNDGAGRTGKSNTFSVVPSYPAKLNLLDFTPVVIENQDIDIKFIVTDRYGNVIPDLQPKLSVEGTSEFKIAWTGENYVLTTKFNETGRKKVKISLKKDDKYEITNEFDIDVIPKKNVLKKVEQ
jgi:prepilin-type N-terminal cleavage/methylation domain-containing protein/prepilin-type processing-associated H-X9-DG protein